MSARLPVATTLVLLFLNQSGATGAGPAKSELDGAVKAYIDSQTKKSQDHKFHAILAPLTTRSDRPIGRNQAGYDVIWEHWYQIPPELRPSRFMDGWFGHGSELDVKFLALDFVKVNSDGLCSLGNGLYFACVDMKATDGKIYDIDFFFAGSSGQVNPVITAVHKINGKPRYNWREQGGVWKFSRR